MQPTGLTADEEQHLARELLCEGSWPREIVIARTQTRYQLPNRKAARRLLEHLGIEGDSK